MALSWLALSALAWLAAAYASLTVQRAVIRDLPPEWRDHPVAGPGYTALLEGGAARSVFSPAVRIAPWLGGLALYVVGMRALGVSAGVALATCAVGGVLWGRRHLGGDRATAREFAIDEGLPYPVGSRWHSRAHAAALYVACVAAALTGGFAGVALWDLVG